MTSHAFDPSEVRRAKSTIYVNSACCAGWIAINIAAAAALGAPRLLGLAASAFAMIVCWALALRDMQRGRVMRGVLNYVISGLLLLLAMALSVPEMSVLFVFATFIFLAFGLSYAERAASLRIVALTLIVAATMLLTSVGLQWTSGVDPDLLRWVNLVGMIMALTIDATSFIALRETLQARGDRLRTTEREREAAAERLVIVSNAAHEFASASGEIEALLGLVAHRIDDTIGDECVIRMIGDAELDDVGRGVAASGEAVLTPGRLAIPLRSRGRTIGVLDLTRSTKPYTIDDQRLAQDLADRAGLAIDNATLVATLERRVRERTTELETVNAELEAFSYSVSHDLRAPLRAIDGFSRALVEEFGARLDDEGRRYLDRIRAGTQRMGKLIDDLLRLAQIGRAPLKLATVDLSQLATEVVAELRANDPGREVEIEIAPGLSTRADTRLVTIMLENLLGNAWKFTARTTGATIEVGQQDDALFVRDNGAGFDMTYAAKLFAPFQRLHATDQFPGDGIGLATVWRIVTHHRGRIWAEGVVGGGATFYFTLGSPR